MPAVRPLRELASIHLDARGDQRALRVSWHTETVPEGLVVLSVWRDNVCTASFRLAANEVPALIELLQAGLDVLGLQPEPVTPYVGPGDTQPLRAARPS